MDNVTWQTVALAAINAAQLVLLAYLNRRQLDMNTKLNGHLEKHAGHG